MALLSPKREGAINTDKAHESFKELTRREAFERSQVYVEQMMTSPDATETHRKELTGFLKLFRRYLESHARSDFIEWEHIKPVKDDLVRPYATCVKPPPSAVKSLLDKLIVVRLNGGLGTSMGCVGPKSVISVRSDLTFLDLTIQQIEDLNRTYDVDVPLVLMNSFNTDDDTRKVLRKYEHVGVRLMTFNQSRYPRFDKESLLPIAKNINDNVDCWYPPGHGDIYQSLANSGLLDQFIAEGKTLMFVSNIDNLGATVDLSILNFLLTPDYPGSTATPPEFLMEVTDKTLADVKGGTLIEYEGRLRLLEAAQVPKNNMDEFKSVRKFRIFNTNNFWASLPAVRRVIDDGSLNMEIIVNPKVLSNGRNVIQLETACGAAIKAFNGSLGVNVPRRRFLPVKTTSDLLVVMSNLYTLDNGALTMSQRRAFPSNPIVKLGTSFSKVEDFLRRFENVPDCVELDQLTVSGDVTFGRNVVLKGTVIIIANHGERIDIPCGATIDNKIIAGNLRIISY